MSNPILLATDLSGVTFNWQYGATTSPAIQELKDYYPDTTSLSPGGTFDPTYLLIDLGTPRLVNTLVIDEFTKPSNIYQMNIYYNTNDDTNWADEVIWDGVNLPYNQNKIYQSFTSITKRYFRIRFVDAGTLGSAPKLGNVFLGKRLEFETTQQWGYMHNVPDWSEGTSQSRAADGRARSAEVFGPIRKFQIAFGTNARQSDGLIAQYLNFLSVARMRPFYYVDHAGNINCVRWSKTFNPYKAVHVDQNTIDTLEMESVLAG